MAQQAKGFHLMYSSAFPISHVPSWLSIFLSLIFQKKYVQNVLVEKSQLLSKLLAEKSHIYVCGDASMASGVREAFKEIFRANEKLSEEEADEKVENLKNMGHYHEDVFGAIHRK